MVGFRRYNPPRRSGPRGRRGLIADAGLAAGILAMLAVVALGVDRAGRTTMSGDAVVNDGDTITVAGERIRLRGIDAPERSQNCAAGGSRYACGRSAEEALRAMVADASVTCVGSSRDRYRRLLAVCSAGGRDLNAAMVEAGWAVAYGGYSLEEAEAREAKRGLWAGEFDLPQAWRRMHGGLDEAAHEAFDGFIARALRYLGLG
ncbi:MAG: thermonuclease family protein [Rhizobiaceae bacterium]|nr:thermonuclease family protein [Rhizobiaceae bacterium]